MKAYSYDENGKLTGQIDCQIDPLGSAAAGHDVFLRPAKATFEIPLPEKDDFDVVFDGKNWCYQEIIEPEPETEPEPTKLELLYRELGDYQSKLSGHDYIGIKIATGRATREDYSTEISQMDEWAQKITEIKSAIKVEENRELA